MIHRVHPNMQLAVFDSLDDLWDPPAGLLGRASPRARPAHDHHALRRVARRRRGSAAGPRSATPCCSSSTSARRTASTRPRSRCSTTRRASCARDPARADHAPGAAVGARRVTSTTSSSSRARSRRPDGTIYLTYGAADRCVGAATVVGADVVAALEQPPEAGDAATLTRPWSRACGGEGRPAARRCRAAAPRGGRRASTRPLRCRSSSPRRARRCSRRSRSRTAAGEAGCGRGTSRTPAGRADPVLGLAGDGERGQLGLDERRGVERLLVPGSRSGLAAMATTVPGEPQGALGEA